MRFFSLTVGLLFMAVAASAVRASSFDDIQLWAGSGSNRAAMVIAWSTPEVLNNTTVPAPVANMTLVWGYRFNGTATGRDMFNAILAADPRLYAIESYGFVEGLGYDLANTGHTGISDGAASYPASAFSSGILNDDAGNINIDAAHATDPSNLYWGGLFGPNWEQWQEQGGTGGFTSSPDRGSNPYATFDANTWIGFQGQWDYAGLGLDPTNISDGSWMGWTVAAGGWNYADNTDPGTIAYFNHKQAPDTALEVPAAPLPSTVWMGGVLLALLGGAGAMRRTMLRGA